MDNDIPEIRKHDIVDPTNIKLYVLILYSRLLILVIIESNPFILSR